MENVAPNTDAAQALFVAGTIPFILLGFVHLVYTWVERTQPFRLTPRNPEVREAMMATELKIYPGTNVWRGWLGFNFSHSVGAIGFNVLVLELAMHDFSVMANNAILLWLPVLFAGSFVLMALRYWFIYPLVGTAMGFVSFAAGALLVS